MEGYCSTGQNPQWAIVPMEEKEEEDEEEEDLAHCVFFFAQVFEEYSG
jgi:hypothetical protein